MRYSFQKEAQAEFLEQLSYYREKNLGLSQDFNNKIKEAINRILIFPEAWTLVDEFGTRRALVNDIFYDGCSFNPCFRWIRF